MNLTVHAHESIGHPLPITTQQNNQYKNNNLEILGAIVIDSVTHDGKKLMEFSGLAWDNDENILYALSDRGFIVHLKPIFDDQQLVDVELLAYHFLLDKNGKAVRYKHADSEGMALANTNNGIQGDTELLVSFERIPRLIRYSVEGKWMNEESLPPDLYNIGNYANENKSLEALTLHPDFGLITGSERPLNNNNYNLFANNLRWSFIPDNKEYGSLVGLTSLPNKKVIAIERSFPGLFAGVTITIHLFEFDKETLSQKRLTRIRPGEELFNDNFEGISWHRSNRFFMISDDNDNFIQRSLLLYFAIPDLNEQLINTDED